MVCNDFPVFLLPVFRNLLYLYIFLGIGVNNSPLEISPLARPEANVSASQLSESSDTDQHNPCKRFKPDDHSQSAMS